MDYEDEYSDEEDAEVSNSSSISWKKLFVLFLLFLFVVSDVCIDNVLPCSAKNGKNITPYGFIILDVILVGLFITFSKFIDTKLI